MPHRLLALFLVLLCRSSLAISIPGLPADSAPATVSSTAANSLEEKSERVQQKLAQAQTQLEQLNTANSNASKTDFTRKLLLEIQVTALRQHLAALTGQQSQEGLAKHLPPVEVIASSVLSINNQRKLLQANRLEVNNLSAILKTQEEQLTELRENFEASQVDLRRKSEALEKSKPEKRAAALEEVKLAQLQLDVRTSMLQAMEERQNYTRAQLQNSRERQESLTVAMKDIPKQPSFSSEELQQVQARIDGQRRAISQQISNLSEAKHQWLNQLDELAKQRSALVDDKEHNTKKTTTSHPDELVEQKLAQISKQERIALLRLDNNSLRIGVLLDLMNSYTLESAFWQMHYSLSQKKENVDLTEFHRSTVKWDAHLNSIEDEIAQAIVVAQMEASLLEGKDEYTQVERQLWLDRAEAFSNAAAELSRLRLLINRWSEQFNTQTADKTVQMRAELWKERLQNTIVSVWQYELFSVADSLQVDGQTIQIARGVTISKVVYAILLITIGFFITVKMANWLERSLINRFKQPEISVRIGKRWLLAVAFIILLINSLMLVRIPLTVFAFLGGAIAIGLGFGMQTLLKNLISGLMMILERPFKPGDTVEVGNLRGTVVDMSVRAAVIRDVNGIETLVPNSTFLEQNVTNWTYSSSLIRQNVKVGVAYGSDVRTVAKLLAEEVGRHGQICPEPQCEILLEDFGADALMFGVYYWIDVATGTIGRQVASDLRFMIEATLRKHEIVIAFPQRDVHVDLAQPLQLQIQRSTNLQK
ncbi:mechanosensitive ion channel [Chitinibacter fontanus]|uniref:Mechanosensitive ion channel n=1 Tax=Chitinibacter fontanus TaxID=1737446 RepID=A0A7D5ZDX4_9NEIS|nr:mechanosensitive ion channel domain-containing protein [Chitinibacter fontanus]QLI80668.1 mechanosensitive ion channel [Chitinibacter fontanus]